MNAAADDVTPVRSPFDSLGGDAPLRRLVDAFYDHMEALPPRHPLRAMHAKDLAPMRDKLFDFLSGWLGGPDRYFSRPDAKCMGSAHARFAIDKETADAWMGCMQQAMSDVSATPEFQDLVLPALHRMTTAMINRS